MSNPFEVTFDSECNNCSEEVREGELMFATEGEFWCEGCIPDKNICEECGDFKKADFNTCFNCK